MTVRTVFAVGCPLLLILIVGWCFSNFFLTDKVYTPPVLPVGFESHFESKVLAVRRDGELLEVPFELVSGERSKFSIDVSLAEKIRRPRTVSFGLFLDEGAVCLQSGIVEAISQSGQELHFSFVLSVPADRGSCSTLLVLRNRHGLFASVPCRVIVSKGND